MARRRINLLPPELAQRRKARQLLSSLGAGGLALVLVLALVYVAQVVRLGGEHHRLEVQQDRNAELQSRISQLAEVDRLQREVEAKTKLLTTLTTDEVRWSVLLGNVSLVIPSDAWLTNFTGQVSTAVAADSAQPLGSITLNGTTFSHIDVAKWLTRLASVQEFQFPYLTLSQKAEIDTTPVVNFNSSVQLSEQAFRRAQRGAERKI